jgi:hypothetical protein
MIRDVSFVSKIRIPDLDFSHPGWIPDSEVKKTPDPGSGSATMISI